MVNPRIITCTGYGGTGSSVVSDLLKEFSNVYSFGDFEFRFLQDPKGIRDLDYGLVQNNNRLTTSYHINNFINYVNFLSSSKVYPYEKFFNGVFKKLSIEYINNLTESRWEGYWHQDIIDASLFEKLLYYTERFYQKKVLKIKDSSAILYNKFFNKKMYYAYPSEDFYIETKKYIRKLVNSTSFDALPYVVFDQLVPPNNTLHYSKYFDDIKIIIIDRDPVDLYLLNKECWKEKWIPTDSVEQYVKWFELLRKHQNYEHEDSSIVLRLSFEDFIYNYSKTVLKVCNFCNLDIIDHKNKFKYFNPNVSVKNTQLEKQYPHFLKDINFIKKKLVQYCYKFNF
ncbi:sulfotransferase [Arsenophonus nasoniae]|uniref:Sulfotransferase n=1 Tax=Arsenophonus nasoniae TaxID=638 RepID=D2U343_9GAMM|nr:sulfotransferase [Arsenophonus nasoniae]WGM02101.1 sulfotransferase [Arsenophonus nasoniae]WGM06365.1 sulfotransferase [Arsenophonus nasoniae]WGM11299.1 sulfotransferase [Arsenophonus nasoniae]WGM15999.1 sulfotransferase [Arsenophonus nasoniae]CBA75642.1 conserved hypothetical protein [Arsenophonus nasoniae]